MRKLFQYYYCFFPKKANKNHCDIGIDPNTTHIAKAKLLYGNGKTKDKMIPNKQFIGTTKRCAKAYPDCGFRPVSFAVRRIYINNIEARKVIINGNATAPFFVNNGAPFPK